MPTKGSPITLPIPSYTVCTTIHTTYPSCLSGLLHAGPCAGAHSTRQISALVCALKMLILPSTAQTTGRDCDLGTHQWLDTSLRAVTGRRGEKLSDTATVIVKHKAAGPTGCWRGERSKLATTHIRHLVPLVSRHSNVKTLSRKLSTPASPATYQTSNSCICPPCFCCLPVYRPAKS